MMSESDELGKIRKRKLKELEERFNRKKMEKTIETNDNDFAEKVIKQSMERPVVVDFWAPWCAPCLMLGPVLERLVDEYGEKFVLAKMNVDGSPQTARAYGIMSIPAVKMFKGGELSAEFVGAVPESAVRQWLDGNL